MLPRIAVIIATYDGRQYLPDCLSSLHAVDYPADRWEIVAVDNASGDGTVEYIRQAFPRVTVLVQDTNTGFAGANNRGLQYALDRGFDYAYLLNQDTVVTPRFLREVQSVAETDVVIAAVQSKLLLYGTAKINSWGNAIHFMGFGYAGGNGMPDAPLTVRDIAYPSGAAVLLRCAVLRQVGLLDGPLFMYHEDLELGWRLWLAGYRCVVAPQSVVYHKYEFSRSVTKWYWMERNRIRVLMTHYRWRTLALLVPAVLVVDGGMICLSIRHGFLRQLLAAHAYFFRPSTWLPLWRRRREVQRLRRVPDREVVKRFVSRIEFQDSPSTGTTRVANIVFGGYWRAVLPLIRW
ncbi:MAG: glycosyltransferase family 2 protein [bacterium]|nr:glycosyltransferase family 2 protein [bacterium]